MCPKMTGKSAKEGGRGSKDGWSGRGIPVKISPISPRHNQKASNSVET